MADWLEKGHSRHMKTETVRSSIARHFSRRISTTLILWGFSPIGYAEKKWKGCRLFWYASGFGVNNSASF